MCARSIAAIAPMTCNSATAPNANSNGRSRNFAITTPYNGNCRYIKSCEVRVETSAGRCSTAAFTACAHGKSAVNASGPDIAITLADCNANGVTNIPINIGNTPAQTDTFAFTMNPAAISSETVSIAIH